MILYLATFALVPLLVEEAGSRVCGELWDAADQVVTTRLTHVEATAALAMAQRLGRIGAEDLLVARAHLAELWAAMNILELDGRLMVAASEAAVLLGLRGYDAVHYAAAVTLTDESLVAAAGDARLLGAWRDAGVSVVDTAV
ncbi:MAG: type II toxin-antitoxin system VapC family toxin [Propionibacterium sp.]|nr:type II toxin-antitoxin system VapC family toxin [Propionibacterium sp.]